MHSSESITKYLTERGIHLTGPLASQDGSSMNFYAFIEIVRNLDDHQKPSNAFLKGIAQELKDDGIIIEFILNNSSNASFESGLRATLLHGFPELVRNVFLSISKVGARVWIVPKSNSIRDAMPDIGNRIQTYLENADIILEKITLTVDENLPTRTAILAELRINAPANSAMLAERLISKGFAAPPEDYLNRHLDALRRVGHIVRRKDGFYCLTAVSLKILGTVKRRNSPDITRLLDLARRKDIQ